MTLTLTLTPNAYDRINPTGLWGYSLVIHLRGRVALGRHHRWVRAGGTRHAGHVRRTIQRSAKHARRPFRLGLVARARPVHGAAHARVGVLPEEGLRGLSSPARRVGPQDARLPRHLTAVAVALHRRLPAGVARRSAARAVGVCLFAHELEGPRVSWRRDAARARRGARLLARLSVGAGR
jgi:hypothetical protein